MLYSLVAISTGLNECEGLYLNYYVTLCVVIVKVAMMETCDWLEVQTSLKVVWSSVMVVCGALSVVISGEHQMPVWPAVSWDSQLQVKQQLQLCCTVVIKKIVSSSIIILCL